MTKYTYSTQHNKHKTEGKKQFLFPRSKSDSERNISFSRIREQKAMNLLLEFKHFPRKLLLDFWVLVRIENRKGMN